MTTQIISTILYSAIAASVLFQIVTAARLAVRVARKRPRPVRVPATKTAPTPTAAPRLVRRRRRDYRVALLAARALTRQC